MTLPTLRIETPRAFLPLLDPKRYKGAHGGRGSGKSHFFAECALEKCLWEGARIVCIREVQNSLKDSVRQLLVDKMDSLGVRNQFDLTRDEVRGPDGSLIIFRGMNDANAENIKSLEGYDVAWVEEAQTLSQRSLDLLRPTIRKPGSELWFSWNPRFRSDPVDEFFRKRKPDSAVCVQVNHNDNPWFPEALKDEMAGDRLADPKKAAHVWDGAYEAAPEGSYYGTELVQADAEGRITSLLIDPALPVHTAWDLGVARNMRCWLFQLSDSQWRWLECIKFTQPGLAHAAEELKKRQQAKGFTWGTHLWPHDGEAVDVGSVSGDTRKQTFAKLGFNVEIVPSGKGAVADGIEAVRRVLKTSKWDRDGCEEGLEDMRGYVRKFDKIHNRYVDEPDKNGCDHTADAKRTAAMGRNLIRNDMAQWSPDVMNFQFAGVP